MLAWIGDFIWRFNTSKYKNFPFFDKMKSYTLQFETKHNNKTILRYLLSSHSIPPNPALRQKHETKSTFFYGGHIKLWKFQNIRNTCNCIPMDGCSLHSGIPDMGGTWRNSLRTNLLCSCTRAKQLQSDQIHLYKSSEDPIWRWILKFQILIVSYRHSPGFLQYPCFRSQSAEQVA